MTHDLILTKQTKQHQKFLKIPFVPNNNIFNTIYLKVSIL